MSTLFGLFWVVDANANGKIKISRNKYTKEKQNARTPGHGKHSQINASETKFNTNNTH